MEKNIITSIEENIRYIDSCNSECLEGFRHERWILYRLETDENIHYFFSMGKVPQNATFCEEPPKGFIVKIDKDRGIPYLVKQFKKQKI